MSRCCLVVLAIVVLAAMCLAAPDGPAPVYVLQMDSHIDPSMAAYVIDGIDKAESDNAQAVLITMDTPGGLMDSMDKIVKKMLSANIPVIVYVWPDGAKATSAGVFILMASHVAAMSPVSNIGSASPVSVNPSGEGEGMSETMKKKVTNMAAESIRSVAEKRGRNADWAVEAVTKAANITSTKALQNNVIDIIAKDKADLMRQLDGRKVKVTDSRTVTLRTSGAPLEEIPMGMWDRFLHYLSNPMVAMFLSLIAMYGIIYELASPGSIFPGVIGGIALILLLYSFSVIPINAAGIAFVVFAIVLFLAEFFVPGTGILTVGGIVSMFFGLMMLFRSTEGFMVPLWTIGFVSVVTGAFFLFVVGIGVRALKKPYISGREGVVGHRGRAKTDLAPVGKVSVDGGLWTATAQSGSISKDSEVVVTAMDGLRLTVRLADSERSADG